MYVETSSEKNKKYVNKSEMFIRGNIKLSQ